MAIMRIRITSLNSTNLQLSAIRAKRKIKLDQGSIMQISLWSNQEESLGRSLRPRKIKKSKPISTSGLVHTKPPLLVLSTVTNPTQILQAKP